MDTIHSYLSTDHHRCDALFAGAEEAVAAKRWQQAARQTEEFIQAMETHFRMEEEVLFPAFEQQTGMVAGPTRIMRIEHEQMRGLFDEMTQALDVQDADTFLGNTETLLVLMQQHNLKEEQILYTMSDRVLGDHVAQLLDQMQYLQEESHE